MEQLPNIQALLREIRNRASISDIAEQLGVSEGQVRYLLRTSDQDLRSFRPELVQTIVSLALAFGIPQSCLPGDAQRVVSMDGRSVFLCHSKDDKDSVHDLYARLLTDGLNPWLDEKNLRAGQEWELQIRKAIRNSIAVVVCLSGQSVDKTGYVKKEIKIALDAADERPEGTIYLIPARLEECAVPDRLSHLHWVDLFSHDGYAHLLNSLDEVCIRQDAT